MERTIKVINEISNGFNGTLRGLRKASAYGLNLPQAPEYCFANMERKYIFASQSCAVFNRNSCAIFNRN